MMDPQITCTSQLNDEFYQHNTTDSIGWINIQIPLHISVQMINLSFVLDLSGDIDIGE